ncbi:MAG TPA: SDR family oxidoreductase [Vicinamibacterales bacterium]|nr:SDR family oxidoreductase [Vicinamibacterales bacterium]
MILEHKVAVVYGAGGAIGGAVAREFAREGAKVFLTGHKQAQVEAIAKEIVSAGGSAEAAALDALDENAVENHLRSVVDKTGCLDISFNAVGFPDANILGIPFEKLDLERFSLPIAAYTTTYLLTARAAAKYMLPKKSGVIMTVSALPARQGFAMNGGYGPAQAAKEQLTRDLSFEFARQGVRVVCLRPHGIPETSTLKEVFEIKGRPAGMKWEQFTDYLANSTHTKRVMRLDEVANVAAFVASDKASGMTGTMVNLSMGALDD